MEMYDKSAAWKQHITTEKWTSATPEEAADMVFLHMRDNWYHLCALATQTEYLTCVFQDYEKKQAYYAQWPDQWNYRFYTQFLRHRD